MPASLHPYVVRRLAEGDAASLPSKKGAALEDVIVRIFCVLPGVELRGRNVINTAGSCEIDILLYNDQLPGGLKFLPNRLLFESKNWAEPVDSRTVEAFAATVRRRHLGVGILVAASGVTGDPEQITAANDIIRQAFRSDNIKLLVVTRAELEGLRTADDARKLMLKKDDNFYLDTRML